MLLFLLSFVDVLYQWPPTVCNRYSFLQKEIRQKKKIIFALANNACCSLKRRNFKMQVILAKVTEKVRTLITIKAEFIDNVNHA